MAIEMDEATKRQVSDLLSRMEGNVTIHLFLSENHCLMCNETRELVEIIAGLAPEGKLVVDVCECDTDTEKAKKYKIDKHPAIVIEGKNKGLIRYFGIPSGHEFGAFIEDIIDASIGDSKILSPKGKDMIKAIDKPVHIQVFVTPTCPYCPRAVRLAHAAAMLNEHVTADMIESMEFQELAMKYRVMGVPKLVFNETVTIEGAPPEPMFLQKLTQSAR